MTKEQFQGFLTEVRSVVMRKPVGEGVSNRRRRKGSQRFWGLYRKADGLWWYLCVPSTYVGYGEDPESIICSCPFSGQEAEHIILKDDDPQLMDELRKIFRIDD